MTEELKPGWRWESFETLMCTVVTAPNGVEYELRAGDIAHSRAQRLLDAMFAALTTSQPAPGVPEDVLAVLQAIHRRPSDAGIWLDDLTHIVRAAVQAKGGEQ